MHNLPRPSVFISEYEIDPDEPVESIEKVALELKAMQPEPGHPKSSPSAGSHVHKASPHTDQINEFMESLRIGTPAEATEGREWGQKINHVGRADSRVSPQLNTPRSSQNPTPDMQERSTSSKSAKDAPSRISESVIREFDSLKIQNDVDSQSQKGSGSNHGTPSRRRRSRSAVEKETHRVENEELPASLSHMRRTEDAFVQARGIAQALGEVLTGSGHHQINTSSIHRLHEEAVKLSQFEPPSKQIVGFVGDSGVGKSSLINSLLDKKDFARSNSNGSACTCVPTEYIYHGRDDFIIESEYFTLENLKKQYEDLLPAYQQNKNLPPGTSQEDAENLRRKAQLAEDTFKTSFGRRSEGIEKVLTLQVDVAVKKMLKWASEMLPRSSQTREAFDDIAECCSRIQELTSEIATVPRARTNQICPWPFVRKIRVYLKSYILSKGLIIADLPGLRDANTARQNITEVYARSCDQILAVTRISRAITDQSVKDILILARKANKQVHIVCTYSDEIRPKEAMDTYPSKKSELQAIQKRIDEARLKKEGLTEEIEDYDQDEGENSEEDHREYAELHRDRLKWERKQEQERFNLHELTINVRNADICKGLRKEYRKEPCGAALRVFCVSNQLYWKHRMDSVHASKKYLDLSGIVELRRHCIGVVAESYVRAVDSFISDSIPALLGSASLWVEAGSGNGNAERKQQILDAIDLIETELEELSSPVSKVNDLSRAMMEAFERRIQLPMEQQTLIWNGSATRASSKWRGWHHSSFAAFCRNYGSYSTLKMGYHCWNEEAMKSMFDAMLPVYGELVTFLICFVNSVKYSVGMSMKKAATIALPSANLRRESQSTMLTLCKTLDHREKLLRYHIDDAIEYFSASLSTLQTDAFSPVRTSFIGILMEDTYQSAIAEYGGGSDQRRKDIITSGYSSTKLLRSHIRLVRDTFRDLSAHIESSITNAIAEHIDIVKADIDILRDQNAILESERNPQFRQTLSREIQRARTELEQIANTLDV